MGNLCLEESALSIPFRLCNPKCIIASFLPTHHHPWLHLTPEKLPDVAMHAKATVPIRNRDRRLASNQLDKSDDYA